ncbi:FixH family protein [Oricola cellulosilytica]|uniref:Cytochrome oxidase n=1 Tax=Oricola cellulosilytica TaxID=1429082 RepID=A0A4R0PCC9_9HYPH|nr:FixH family protein [Oricola cellulosilytica]TCD14936.1 cytochrome oxidase [Oricola cellulosilytica]
MRTIEKIFAVREFTGWHMIGVMVLFFGTIISVNLVLAFYANSSWTGLVVKNSYVESQRFNTVTAEKRAQQALGWKAVAGYGDNTLSIDLTDAAAAPIRNAIVTARVGHPAHENNDLTVTLLDEGGANYAAPVELTPGLWAAHLTVTGPDGTVWTREIRFTVETL